MGDRRSEAINRIARARGHDRGALDQLSDETLFRLADLHSGAIRPSPASRRRRWTFGACATAALLAIVVIAFSWADAVARSRAAEEQSRVDAVRLIALQKEAETLAEASRVWEKVMNVAKSSGLDKSPEWAELLKNFGEILERRRRDHDNAAGEDKSEPEE